MKAKLKDITTEYSKFNANQVLTEKQLNTFIDYFEDQDRLSRLGLSGVGIACGFQMNPIFTVDQKAVSSIRISQGTGVTTDGDLVQFFDLLEENLKTKTFRYYKKFEDDKAKYPRFLDSEKNQFNLWELHAHKDDSFTDLVKFEEIKKMAVILYVEQYPKEDELCNKINCDNQGIEQINNIRVLLVRCEDLEAIAIKDTIFHEHDWYKINDTLPVVEARRVVLKDYNTKTFTSLKQQFDTVIKDESITTDLILGYDVLLSKFGKQSITAKIKSLFNFSALAVPLDFQYRYDLFKDLIDTYNEIKDLLLHINVACCPNIGAFPKHLMLGKIDSTVAYPELRHRFYKSTIVGHENKNLQKVISLLNRAILIAHSYVGTSKTEEVEITPSQAHTCLSEKAVPFYYNVSSLLLENWDFTKTDNYRANQNLSYHKGNLKKALSIQKPLAYNIDKNDFYRIEGHQGKMYREALAKIDKLKRDNGLSFDVKALSINATEQNININDYECEFGDLKMLLSAWKTEQNCILSEVSKTFSAFKLSNPKENIVTDKITRKEKLIEEELIASPLADFNEEVNLSEELKGISKESLILDQEALYRYDKTNIVKESLTREEDSIGFLIDKVFDKKKEGSASDIIVELEKETTKIKESEAWANEPELSEFILTDVTETLIHAYVLDKKVPINIKDVSNVIIQSYKLTIEKLCQQVKKLQARYNSTTLKPTTKQILGLLVNQLSIVCCSGKKLETLLAEIEKRKLQILQKIQLSEFVKHHPGLEHKAGVIPGGTFVMVYVTENAADKNTFDNVVLELRFREQPIVTEQEIEFFNDDFFTSEKGLLGKKRKEFKNGGVIQLWDKSSTIHFTFIDRSYLDFKNKYFFGEDVVLVGKTLADTVSNFSAFLNRTWSRAGLSDVVNAKETLMYKDGTVGMRIIIKDKLVPKNEYYLQMFNPNILGTNKQLFFDENEVVVSNATLRNTVVADFSLPYMCCSDCAPINFIVPKEPPFLSLPVDYICLKEEDIEPLVFTKRPLDGIVKALIPEELDSGIYEDEGDGKTKLDVTKIDKSFLGKEINFTVNDEPTDCKIIVYPDINLKVTVASINYNDDKSQADVTYALVWENIEGISDELLSQIKYGWDFFGDGNKTIQKPVNNKLVRTYMLPIGEKNTITPSLEISLGPCNKTIAIETIVFEIFTPSELGIISSYCFDTMVEKKARIPFTGVNGAITVEGQIAGVTIENNELVIDAVTFKAFDQVLTFREDGQETNAQITIHEVIQISITEGKETNYYWKGGQLIFEGAFQPVIPDHVDPLSLKYSWKTETAGSDTELFTPGFVLTEGGENAFKVVLTVTSKNGCISTTSITKEVEYPEFIFKMKYTEFCWQDEKAYPIAVDPNFKGMLLKGKGVRFNKETNRWEFIPALSEVTGAGKVIVQIVGTSVTQEITLKDVAIASFTHKFNIETGALVLTNTSEIGKEYIWNIDGKEIIRTTRTAVTVKVNNEIVRVSLTVISDCGKNTRAETIELFGS